MMGPKGGLQAAVESACADQCRWENTGLPTAGDKKAMAAMVQGFIDGYQLDHMRVELVPVVVRGDTVMWQARLHGAGEDAGLQGDTNHRSAASTASLSDVERKSELFAHLNRLGHVDRPRNQLSIHRTKQLDRLAT